MTYDPDDFFDFGDEPGGASSSDLLASRLLCRERRRNVWGPAEL
jgi:hypothetical protein